MEIREFDRFRLDAGRKTVYFDGVPVDMPLKEIEILCVLTENAGSVVSKEELLDRVWGKTHVEESNISRQVYLLRKRFAEFGLEGDLIQTIPRRGYRFSGDVSVTGENLIIERHVIEQVVVREIEMPDSASDLPRTSSLAVRHYLPTFAVGLLLILMVGVFAAWRYGNPSVKSTSELRSLAVLPLGSFSSAPADQDLRLRITDALITRLAAGDTGLSVRPTRSILIYTNTERDPLAIGRDLEVDAVMDGRVQQEGERLRVTLQLVSVASGEQLWSQQFDGKAGHILELQDNISTQLLKRLDRRDNDHPGGRITESDEAYEYYLRARFAWNKRSRDSLETAISLFKKAVEIDAAFAEAYVGLADSYYLLYDYSYDTSTANVEAAKVNIIRAIELNPELSEAFATLGLIQTTHDWNWKEAEQSLRKAVSLAPNSPNAHHRLGVLMTKLRRFDEGDAELRRAKELDPTSPAINMNLAIAHRSQRRYSAAIEQLKKFLELDERFTPAIWTLGLTHILEGNRREGLLNYIRAIEIEGDKGLADRLLNELDRRGETAALEKLEGEWRKKLSPTDINEHDMAIISSLLGKKSETLDWLERAVAARHPWATWINAEPEFDFVRTDPRFQSLLKKMRFE